MLKLLAISAVLALAIAEPKTYQGKKCTIPFVYNGVEYDDCTDANDSKLWCATGPKDYEVGSGEWAYCCPKMSGCRLDCSQLGGFQMDQNCKKCECQLSDPCKGGRSPCGSATCKVKAGKAECRCPSNKRFDASSKSCKVPDPCKGGRSPCGSATCKVKAGKAECSCPSNKRFDASSKSCKAVVPVLAKYHLSGNNRYQSVNAVRFQTRSFSICVKFRLNGWNRYQTLVGDWTSYWQFLFRIQSNNQLMLTLRRNINSRGSNPKQDMVTVTGGNVANGNWQTACGDWDHSSGIAYMYHNGRLVGQRRTQYGDHTLQKNNHATYQVGWKGDTRNEFVAGQITAVAFYGGIVKDFQ